MWERPPWASRWCEHAKAGGKIGCSTTPMLRRSWTRPPGAFPGGPGPGAEPAASGPRASLGAAFYAHGVVRTRFFDDYLTAAAGGGHQLVLLAAGLDTRAFRLTWPRQTHIFELDLPTVLNFKDTVLAANNAVPRCRRTALPVDLRQDWPTTLLGAGFDPTARTAWLAEGLLLYLTAEEADRLLTAVGGLSAPGSRLSFEHGPMTTTALLTQAREMPEMDQYTSLWKGGLGEDASHWLTHHGWRHQFHDLATVATFYGRPVPASSSGGFLTAVRAGS
jgi:methyltransferase (TIGR00027 family)